MSKRDKLFSLIGMCLIGLLAIFSPSLAQADGMAIDIQGSILSEPGQKAVIIWDKSSEEETLILNASFGIQSLSNFCWIIPIQSLQDPQVKASDSEVFQLMEDLFPTNTRSWLEYPNSYSSQWGGYGSATIDVLTIQKIGVYDLATIWASDPNDLADWLEHNGYDYLPLRFSSTIKTYTQAEGGCYFVVNKIDLENEFATPLAALRTRSIAIYNRLMADNLNQDKLNDLVDDLRDILSQDIINGMAYSSGSFAGYIMSQAGYNDLKSKWLSGSITSSSLKSKVRTSIVSSGLFNTVFDLFEGAGTPLEITFYPNDPTYPLYISSLSSNYGGIDVYFIGPYKVDDKNQILRHWKSTSLTSDTESDLAVLGIDVPSSCTTISLLLYRGYLNVLQKDSVFTKYRESQGTTPTTTPYYPYPYYSTPYYPTPYPYYYPTPQYSYSPYPFYNSYSYPSYNPPVISPYPTFNIFPWSGFTTGFNFGYPYGGSSYGSPYGSWIPRYNSNLFGSYGNFDYTYGNSGYSYGVPGYTNYFTNPTYDL